MSEPIKAPNENPSRVEDILSDTVGLPGYEIEPPRSRVETLLIMLDGSIAANVVATIDPSTYVLTLTLKNKNNETIGTPSTIDLPLESTVMGGRYDSTSKTLILTLTSGSTIDIPLNDLIYGLQNEITSENPLSADLVDDTNTTHKFNVQANWTETSSSAASFIQNKPTLGTASALDVAVSGDASLTQAVKGDDSRLTDSRTPTAHNQASSTITTMTGYTEDSPTTADSILTSDSLNAAVRKLETGVETNKTNISSVQTHIKFSANSKTYYLQPEQPSSPVDGDIWIG